MKDSLITTERRTGVQILIAAAAVSVALSVFNYFWTGNGIHGSPGGGTAGGIIVNKTAPAGGTTEAVQVIHFSSSDGIEQRLTTES